MVKPLKKYNVIISKDHSQRSQNFSYYESGTHINDGCHLILAKAENNTAVNSVVKICFQFRILNLTSLDLTTPIQNIKTNTPISDHTNSANSD